MRNRSEKYICRLSIVSSTFFVLCLLFVACVNHSPADRISETENNKVNISIDTLKVVPIQANCEDCRETGDTAMYKQIVHIKKNDLGYVRVRKDASCFEANIGANVIGKIKDDIWVYAQGPLKNAGGSAGIAFAIIVKDRNGKIWRGYLSYTLLDRGAHPPFSVSSPLN